MKKKNGFALREVCGAKFLLAEGLETIDFSKLIALNETSVFLWEAMGDGEFTAEQLTEKLCEEYEVEYPQALADVKALINSFIDAGVIG